MCEWNFIPCSWPPLAGTGRPHTDPKLYVLSPAVFADPWTQRELALKKDNKHGPSWPTDLTSSWGGGNADSGSSGNRWSSRLHRLSDPDSNFLASKNFIIIWPTAEHIWQSDGLLLSGTVLLRLKVVRWAKVKGRGVWDSRHRAGVLIYSWPAGHELDKSSDCRADGWSFHALTTAAGASTTNHRLSLI